MASLITDYVRRKAPRPSGRGGNSSPFARYAKGLFGSGNGSGGNGGSTLAEILGATQPPGGSGGDDTMGLFVNSLLAGRPLPRSQQAPPVPSTPPPSGGVSARGLPAAQAPVTVEQLLAALGSTPVPKIPTGGGIDIGAVKAPYDQAISGIHDLQGERERRLDQLHQEALKNVALAQHANEVSQQAAQQAAAQTAALAHERMGQGYDSMMADMASQGVTGAPARMLAAQQSVAQQGVEQRSQSAQRRAQQAALDAQREHAFDTQVANDTNATARDNLSANVAQAVQALLSGKAQAVSQAEQQNAAAERSAANQQAQLALQARQQDAKRRQDLMSFLAKNNQGVHPNRDKAIDLANSIRSLNSSDTFGVSNPSAAAAVASFENIIPFAKTRQEASKMFDAALASKDKDKAKLAGTSDRSLLDYLLDNYYSAVPGEVDSDTARMAKLLYGVR